MGNKLSIEDAYRFAKGDALVGPGGETMQLSRPLDFVAITDHAEGFGSRTHCSDPNLSLRERASCWLMGLSNPALFTIFVDGSSRHSRSLAIQRSQRVFINPSSASLLNWAISLPVSQESALPSGVTTTPTGIGPVMSGLPMRITNPEN